MIDRRNLFDQPVKNNVITYDNIRKIATGQGDEYTTGCLLEYNCFNNYYKMIATDLSKQQILHDDPKASTDKEDRPTRKHCFSLLKKRKKLF